MNDCLFCKIIKGEIPSYKIYEDEHTYAFLDISNDFLGHTLIIPKVHADNIFDINKESLYHLTNTTKLLCEHYKSRGFTGINIQNNSGETAGQTVFHIHVHVIPRGITKDTLKILKLNGSTDDLKRVSEVFFIKK